MKSTLKSKKGNVAFEVLIIVILLVAFSISILTGNKILHDINDSWQNDTSLSNESRDIMSNATTDYPSVFDGAFLMVMIGLWIASIISAFFIDTHPAFFIISAFLLVVVLGVVMLITNSFVDVQNDAEFISFKADYPVMSWIMGNLLMVSMIIGSSILITLFAKGR